MVQLLAGLATGLILALLTAWWLLRARSRGDDLEMLSDGAVLLISDGVVQQCSPAAGALLGDCLGCRISELLEQFLATGSTATVAAVDRLEMTGDPIDMLVRARDGNAFELIGAPSGALIRLILRDARYLDERLREADARVLACEAALRSATREQEALQALVAEGPIIAWHRTSAGEVNWSAGQIRTGAGVVTPEQAIELIVARTRLNGQPAVAGEPQKSRIEIVVGDAAETVSLHVVEMFRQDGSRIGYATDAGPAAAAERTLSRFVQTMTETFAHLTVGLAIFDRNQTLALFNPALVQMWQVEPAWLARRPSLRDILDELRAIRRLPELEDFHTWRSRLQELFDNTEAADYEELWHLADGSNIRVLARPHPHGALAFTFDDVTERMRLEQRYRHSIDLRRATLDGLSQGIAVFGANGLLQFVNQAFHEIWGTDAETVYPAMHARQLIGLCEEMAAAPDVWQKLHGFITGEESRRSWSARLTTNARRELTARFAPLPDGSTLAVFSDVTAFEQIGGELLHRNAALELAEAARILLADLLGTASEPALRKVESEISALAHSRPDQSEHTQTGGAASAAELRQIIEQAAMLTARPLQPSGDRDSGNPAEALRYVAAISELCAKQAGVALSIDTSEAPARVSVPEEPICHLAFQVAKLAIDRSKPGSTVVLRADGTANEFAIHAQCSASTPQPASLSGALDPLARLSRLAAREGGRVDFRQDTAGGPACLTCRFGVRPPERGDQSPWLAAPADGTVHALKPNAC